MLAFSEGWIMDFSDIPPKEALLSNFEDFCRLALQVEAEKHMPDLYQKIQNLSQSQAPCGSKNTQVLSPTEKTS